MTKGAKPSEIKHFASLSSSWHSPQGPMHTLHRFNPLRLQYIKYWTYRANQKNFEHIPSSHFKNIILQYHRELGELRVNRTLDVGAGAGLLTQHLIRFSNHCTALEPVVELTQEMQRWFGLEDMKGNPKSFHEDSGELEIICGTLEDIQHVERFQLISALEVIEHVPDPQQFVVQLSQLLAPGGVLFLSTLSRTIKSYLMAIIGAEYLTGVVPFGTHSWNQFITPQELRSLIEKQPDLQVMDVRGINYDYFSQQFEWSNDQSVNYIMAVRKLPTRVEHNQSAEML